jgi:hypothetical protein
MCRPSSQRACGCSLPATPARTMDWTLSPPCWPLGPTSGYPRLIPRLVRRYCASFPRGAKTWSPSVPERSRQPARTPAGPRARWGTGYTLGSPSRAHPARHTTARRLGPHPPAVGFGDLTRRAGTGAKDRGPQRAHRSRGRSLDGTSLIEIFGIGPIMAAKIIGAVGNVERFPTKAHFASHSGTAPVGRLRVGRW